MSDGHEHGMSLIVKTVTRLTVGLILLYGIYIVLHGHISHGGGFSGGVIIALSLVHLTLAFGKDDAKRRISEHSVLTLQAAGTLLFLAVALMGFVGGRFFLNFIPKREPFGIVGAGIIPICNIGICLNVGAGLFAALAAVMALRIADGKEEGK